MKATFEKLIQIKFWFEYSGDIENLDWFKREELEKKARKQIFKMIMEDYTSGELCESIDDQEFYGWWEYSIENK
jgi:hypothetical protein